MSNPFIGEIRMFGGNFAPAGWAFCDGTLLPIASNDALFALIGTIYGGDGLTTFALPDLRGRIPVHFGNSHVQGERGGNEQVALTANQIPPHNHSLSAMSATADQRNPANASFAISEEPLYALPAATPAVLDGNAISSTGNGQTHSNLQPYQCVNFIIALTGIFPSRA